MDLPTGSTGKKANMKLDWFQGAKQMEGYEG